MELYPCDCIKDEAVAKLDHVNLQEVVDVVYNWEINVKMKLFEKKHKDMWMAFTSAIPEPPPLTQ